MTKKKATDTAPAKRKVLIVDDDGDFCASTRAMLEAQGYAVACAASGKEGLAKVGKEKPDLIILDIMMENSWAGYEVNQALKFGGEGGQSIPILMVSSVPMDPQTRFAGAGEVGMVTPDAYLTKPLDIPRFLEVCKSLLGGGRD